MNTNPDETALAQWLEDELQGDALAAVSAWAEQHPEHLAARDEIRRWKRMIASAVPATEEPPAGEFFNARIARALRAPEAAPMIKRRVPWNAVFLPLAACAGMAFTFWLGMTRNAGPPEIDVAGAPRAIPVDPILYTPERGVKAEWFASSDAAATVIVLDGVDAIPDSMDFSATASFQPWREFDSTAELETVETSSP